MEKDLDLLQGTWTVAAMETDGREMPADLLGKARIVIEGSRFISSGMGAVYEGTLRLDASASPARIDMTFDAGPEKGNTNLGIYHLDGDSWKLCLATHGTVRPESFTAPRGAASRWKRWYAELCRRFARRKAKWTAERRPGRRRSSKASGKCSPA